MPSDSTHAKVEFVTNLRGTTIGEILAIGGAVPIALLLRRAVHLHPSIARALPEPLLDYATVVVIPLAALLLDAHAYAFLLAAFLAGVALAAAAAVLGPQPQAMAPAQAAPPERSPALHGLTGSRKLVLTYFRAGLMVLTCSAILAVDFRVFPRRLAKAETFGVGLMDVGPGSFVFAQGLVVGAKAAEPRRQPPAAAAAGAPALLSALTRGPLPLLLLGAARLVSTTAVGYQVHVGEYGAHWNFFVTLSVVAAAAAALGRAPRLPGRPGRDLSASASVFSGCGLLSCGLLLAHQAALSRLGLGPWVAKAERDPGSLLELNKEGIVSSVGYVAIYYAGAAAGALYTRRLEALAAALAARGKDRGARGAALAGALLQLWAPVGALWSVLWALTAAVEPISRRSANAPYCVFIAAFCCLLAMLEVALHRLRPGGRARAAGGASAGGAGAEGGAVQLLVTVNDNLLLTFLAANLMTGAVNLSMDTLGASDSVAWVVLLVYMALVGASAALFGRLSRPSTCSGVGG